MLHFDEKELKTDLGNGNFIFVGSSCDMFASAVPHEWVDRVLEHTRKFDNKYLFQTRNLRGFYIQLEYVSSFSRKLPENCVIATTLETNYDYEVGPAPKISERACYFRKISGIEKYISIEPIVNFDLPEFVSMIKRCKPSLVSIGADSGGHHLPEPPKGKIIELISELRRFTKVIEKKNLRRLTS